MQKKTGEVFIKITHYYQKLKFLLSTNRIVFKNISFLFVLQFSNYLFPIITLPYLARTLGPDSFGLYAFSNSSMGYFITFLDFGFTFSITKAIAINKKNKTIISDIISSVLFIKLLISFFCLVIFLLLLLFIPVFKHNSFLFLLSFLVVIFQTYFPIWYFQGIEEMNVITILNVSSRVITTVLIFCFIKYKNDFILLQFINLSGQIIVCIVSYFLIRNNRIFLYFPPNMKHVKKIMTGSLDLFISNLFISLYTTSTPLILGLFVNSQRFGIYSGGDRIVRAFQSMTSPIIQAIYPPLCNKFESSKVSGVSSVKKSVIAISFFTLIISITLFILSDLLVMLLLGPKFKTASMIIRIESLLPFVIPLSALLGVVTMTNINYTKEMRIIYLSAGLVNIILAPILIYKFHEAGAAMITTFIECAITISFFIVLYRRNILINGKES